MNFTQGEVRAYYAARFQHLKLTNQREWRMACPIHQGTGLNFAVSSETGMAHCHSQCGRGWDMLSLEQEISGLDFPRAKDKVYEIIGRPKVPWGERDVQAIYDYTDETGSLLYQVLRYATVPKTFKQRRPDNGGFVWGLGDARRVPFRLEKIKNSEFIGIAEGEKCVLHLERIGMTATCNSGGAGNLPADFAQYFTGKHVAIFPDNDEPGRAHALKVAAMVSLVAKSLKIIEIPNLPEKGDVADFVNKGGTLEQVRELYRKAQQWTPEWEFSRLVPHENARHYRTFEQSVEAAGGVEQFWSLARLVGVETPWRNLSLALGGGLRDGEVYVIGANQGAGKTSMALQFIIAAIKRSEGVLMFSMEMNWESVYQRMAAIEARVDLREFNAAQAAVRYKKATPEERMAAQVLISECVPRLAAATRELMPMPLLVSTKSAVNPQHIIDETARLRKEQKIKLVVVDHMQLMSATGSERGDYEKTTAISRASKQVASDIGAPVLILSQTSRLNTREHRELEASDLRGSGAIEEDAAAVMLLYEDKADADAARGTERYYKGPLKSWLKLGKNRYGEQYRYFPLEHHKAITRFDSPEDE